MRTLAVLALALGLGAGLLAGFLWWGMSDRQRDADLRAAQDRAERLERQIEDAQSRLKAIDKELAAERERRTRLEMVLSEGKK